MKDTLEMREVYSRSLVELGEKNDNIVVLDADLMRSNGAVIFKEKFPQRTFDIGVAEQNMISIAGGLSAYGFIPFASTFAVFASRRVMDQVMISVAYAKQNVKIVGTDPGISAELNGGTHMPFEDIGMMRTIPGMTIFEPVDAEQLKQAMPQIAEYYGPVYIRLFRKTAYKIYNDDYCFKLGKADTLIEGKDATIFASGLMVKPSLEAAEMLKKEKLRINVINIHTIKPLDTKAVIDAAKKTEAVVTVENHNIYGGLGSAIAETLGENYPVPIIRVGVNDMFGEVGDYDYLAKRFGLTADNIAKAVIKVIKKKNRMDEE